MMLNIMLLSITLSSPGYHHTMATLPLGMSMILDISLWRVSAFSECQPLGFYPLTGKTINQDRIDVQMCEALVNIMDNRSIKAVTYTLCAIPGALLPIVIEPCQLFRMISLASIVLLTAILIAILFLAIGIALSLQYGSRYPIDKVRKGIILAEFASASTLTLSSIFYVALSPTLDQSTFLFFGTGVDYSGGSWGLGVILLSSSVLVRWISFFTAKKILKSKYDEGSPEYLALFQLRERRGDLAAQISIEGSVIDSEEFENSRNYDIDPHIAEEQARLLVKKFERKMYFS